VDLRTGDSRLKRLSVAARPSILFATAFALVTTPHEAAHALTAYSLGFNLTLFKMWVNPDAASATPWQSFVIAVAGPLFSLLVGVSSLVLYRLRFKQYRSGLLFLMLAVVGTYSFLGPMAAVAFGGDFNVAFRAVNVPRLITGAVSALGLIILPAFMGFIGRELLGWARAGGSRSQSVLIMTVAPWLLGTLLVSLIYWPLPGFIIGSNVAGSVFWLFAVAGASFCKIPSLNEYAGSPLTISDLIVTLLAVGLVMSTTNGIRIAH
jgi:hypothetical protein